MYSQHSFDLNSATEAAPEAFYEATLLKLIEDEEDCGIGAASGSHYSYPSTGYGQQQLGGSGTTMPLPPPPPPGPPPPFAAVHRAPPLHSPLLPPSGLNPPPPPPSFSQHQHSGHKHQGGSSPIPPATPQTGGCTAVATQTAAPRDVHDIILVRNAKGVFLLQPLVGHHDGGAVGGQSPPQPPQYGIPVSTPPPSYAVLPPPPPYVSVA